ncbi:MAG: MFS transporter [Nitrososphaeria archaeon]|nr:MFS transporter [Conexivisphaerales archaeon]
MRLELRRALEDYRNLKEDTKRLAMYSFANNLASNLGGFITIFFVIYLGYGVVFYGIISAIGGFTFVILLIPSSFLTYLKGSKHTVLAGSVFQALSYLLIMIYPAKPTLIASSIVGSLGSSMNSAALNPLISKSESLANRTKAFSLNYFFNNIGAFIGTAFSGSLVDLLKNRIGYFSSYRSIFAVSASVFLVSSYIISRVHTDLKPSPPKIDLKNENVNTIYKLAIPAGLIGAGAGFLIPYFPLQFRDRFNLSVSVISVIFSITNLFLAFFALYMPALERRLGSLRSIISSWVLATTFMVLMPFIGFLGTNPVAEALFAAFYLVRTLTMNVITPVQSSFELSLLNDEYKSIGSSIETLTWNSVYSVTVIFGAYLMRWSLNAPFFVCATFYYASAIIYYKFFSKASRKE